MPGFFKQRLNPPKTRAGAVEVWLVSEDGTIEMHHERGRVAASTLGIAIASPPA